VVSFPQVSPTKTPILLSSPPYMLYAPPILFFILSLEQYCLRSMKQRLDTFKATCFVIRQSVSKFGVLNTLFTSTWSILGSAAVLSVDIYGHFRGTCCLHHGVAVGRSGYGGRVDQGRVQAEPTGSGGWVGGWGVSWTSKSAKKQNGTIENSVYGWSELENSQKKGWLQHGVPVRESEWRNTNKSLGN